ncbi:MAG: transposase [Elusimicrobiota bacterium]|nr:transposase [Elusimicrobiota bacterium]
MPRNPRAANPNGLLHVISRGVERRMIYADDADRRIFIDFMRESFERASVRLFSYCLMGNHFHLLLDMRSGPIGIPMHLLLTRYAHHFNQRHKRVGHLFQNRFNAIPCLEQRHFITILTYIHLNPVRAGLVKKPGLWRWSSHRDLISGSREVLHLDDLPDSTGMTLDEVRSGYDELLAQADESCSSLERIIDEAAALAGLTAGALRQGGRSRAHTLARIMVVNKGITHGFTVKELSAALNCTAAAIHQLRARSHTR